MPGAGGGTTTRPRPAGTGGATFAPTPSTNAPRAGAGSNLTPLGASSGGINLSATQVLMMSPAQLDYYARIYGTDATALLNWATVQEGARQFNITNDQTIKQAALDRAAAEKDRAQWAAAYTEAASINNQGAMAQARAQVEAANINAQAAIETANIAAEASKYSDDIKAQIAKEANELERQRLAATEWDRPSDWGARIGFLRGQTPEQAAALTKYAGGMTFAAPGGTSALPQTQPATAGAAPAALVGDKGVELASALPGGGMQITPLQAEQARNLRGQGLPQMAAGGIVSQTTPPRQPYASRLGLVVGGGKRPVAAGYGGSTNGHQPATPATPATPIVGPGGESPVPVTPAATPIDQLPFLVAGRAGGQYNVAPFQAWTGERTAPEIGVTTPIPTPWEFNLNQWNNLARSEQAMWAGLWRRKMMISGETEDELLMNAREAIGRSAFTGMASALPQYSGMR